jgi:ABC-type branched-subunit amino acid transport system ATPase component
MAEQSLRPGAGSAGALLALRGVRKRFGAVQAIDGVDLDIGEGRFVTLLGPRAAARRRA